MGGGGAFVQARKRKGPRRRGVESRGPWGLLCGGGRNGRGLRGGVALVELGGAEGAPVDEEAVDSAGVLGQRLAEDRGAAFGGCALAGRGAARPGDVAGD